MKPRINLAERLSVAVLIVLADPTVVGLPETWQTPDALTYGALGVLGFCLLVDGHKLARALRAAADVVDDEAEK
jgi:hypothetical protein